jgi:lysozyme
VNRAAIIDHLEKEEGFRSLLYDDATGKPLKPGDRIVGHPTAGIGLALDIEGLTREEARYLCENRVAKRELALDQELPGWRSLSEARQLVLLSMAYQMGVRGLLGFAKMIAALQRGDFAEAADEMLASVWATQTPARAQRLAEMVRQG